MSCIGHVQNREQLKVHQGRRPTPVWLSIINGLNTHPPRDPQVYTEGWTGRTSHTDFSYFLTFCFLIPHVLILFSREACVPTTSNLLQNGIWVRGSFCFNTLALVESLRHLHTRAHFAHWYMENALARSLSYYFVLYRPNGTNMSKSTNMHKMSNLPKNPIFRTSNICFKQNSHCVTSQSGYSMPCNSS